jgi:hypothetical protein
MARRLSTLIGMVLLVLGVAVAAPAAASTSRTGLTQSPRNLALGNVPLNTTVVLTFTVTNRTADPVTNTGFSLSYGGNGGFQFGSVVLDPGTCEIGGTLAPGDSCTYSYSGFTASSGKLRDGLVCYLVGQVNVADNVCSKFTLVIGKQ